LKKCSPEELFAQRLAHALGVRVADMRVIDPSSEEAGSLRLNVKHASPAAGESDSLPVKSILRFEFLCVMEFLDGVGMMGMPAHDYLKKLEGTAEPRPWRELGRLMAFDMLVNNLDRLPLAWSNEGNLSNIMLGSSVGTVVGIDQGAAPIKHEDGLQRFLQRVRQAVREARDGEGKAFGAVVEAIFNNTGMQLAPGEVADMRQGCLDFARELAGSVEGPVGLLDNALDEVCREVRGCFARQQTCDEVVSSTRTMVQRVAAAMQEEVGR